MRWSYLNLPHLGVFGGRFYVSPLRWHSDIDVVKR